MALQPDLAHLTRDRQRAADPADRPAAENTLDSYSEHDLVSAVEAGILSTDQAEAFRAHAALRQPGNAADEEHFRLISGFNDIFVVIACLLLLGALAWIGSAAAPWLGPALVALAAWGLAEFFVRKRRMALPAIVLLMAFTGAVFAVGIWLMGAMAGDLAGGPGALALAGALAAAGAWLHWQRFRVPVTVAAGAAASVTCVFALLLAVLPGAKDWTGAMSLAAGIAVFALAMRWDAADPRRQTRHSDVAFWLHLLAAPLLVHPVFTWLRLSGGEASALQVVAVVLLYVAIALVSLSIDRRALMVSALGYVLYTFTALLGQYGVVSLGFALTALTIGSALLLLSAFWHASRVLLLKHLPLQVRRWLAPSQ